MGYTYTENPWAIYNARHFFWIWHKIVIFIFILFSKPNFTFYATNNRKLTMTWFKTDKHIFWEYSWHGSSSSAFINWKTVKGPFHAFRDTGYMMLAAISYTPICTLWVTWSIWHQPPLLLISSPGKYFSLGRPGTETLLLNIWWNDESTTQQSHSICFYIFFLMKKFKCSLPKLVLS